MDHMFTNKNTLGGGDVEAGNSTGHVRDMETMASSAESSFQYRGNFESHNPSIDKWVVSLERKLGDVPQYMCSPGHPGRICRIPENIREVDRKAYEPCSLSIGPYHHGKQRLQEMERRKQLILKCFLKQKPELTVKDCLKEIKSIELKARSFYTGMEMESEKFVQMLLLDGLFILVMFCGMAERPKRMKHTNMVSRSGVDNEETNEESNQINEGRVREDHDPNMEVAAVENESIYETRKEEDIADGLRWFLASFAHDLFLLENQLPFFVLQKIHVFAYGGPPAQLIETMNIKIGNLFFNYTKLDSKMFIPPTVEVHHLLHLGHLFFHPKLQLESMNCQLCENSQMFRLGSALQLYEAGVRFEARSRSTEYSLLDVSFDGSGTMIMPCLHVDDNTVSLLRNLIALEQMKYPSLGLDVSGYAVLLLHLVTIPADVKLLRRKGIIEHHLASDKEMVSLINRLSVGLAFDYFADKYSLKHVFQGLKSYSDRRVPRWRAWLRQRYFNNPWTMISLLAAFLLLLLTFVQTYYMLYSYYYPCLNCRS